MQVEVRDISPDEASELLDSQVRNRRLRRGHIRQMARAMAQGDWRQNGEAIKFDEEGRLRDGQHRLAAIVESGVTVSVLVVTGLPEEAQETMDMGVRRTMADLLRLRGESNTHLLAATLSVLFRLRHGSLGSLVPGDHPTHQELLRLLTTDPDIRAYVQRGRGVSERVDVSSSLASALWYEFSLVDDDEAARFFEALKAGENLQEGDPVFALRRLLERDRRLNTRRSRYQLAGLIIKAWNYSQEGTTVRSISFKAGGRTPDRFPSIVTPPSVPALTDTTQNTDPTFMQSPVAPSRGRNEMSTLTANG